MKTCNRISGPGNEFGDIHIDLESIFDHWMGGSRRPRHTRRHRRRSGNFMPRTDIIESETAFEVHVELPGVDADSVSVEVSDGNLMITGEKKTVELAEGSTAHRSERRSGKFNRSFEFPVQVDFEKIAATFKAGVLSVSLPKSERVLPRKIDVQFKD